MKIQLRYICLIASIFLFFGKINAQVDSLPILNEPIAVEKDSIVPTHHVDIDEILHEEEDSLLSVNDSLLFKEDSLVSHHAIDNKMLAIDDSTITVDDTDIHTPAVVSKVDTIHIQLDPEEIDFSVNDSMGCAPFTVFMKFKGSATVRKYKWEFGDGESSSEMNPRHTFLRPGVYSLKLTVYGQNDSVIKEKGAFVHVFEGSSTSFSTPKTCFCTLPAKAVFFNYSKSAANHFWYFPGGEPASFEGFSPPEVTYAHAGNYPVTLISEGQGGCKDTLTFERYIRVSQGPNFSAMGTNAACPPFAVTFKDSTVGCAKDWVWDFGDGKSKSIFRDPIHIYSEPGNYDVKLTVSFEGGCKDSVVKKNFVQLASAKVAYKLSNSTLCQGEPLSIAFRFKGYILFEPENEVLRVISTPKDKDSIAFQYTYPNVGNYRPNMTFIDSTGCIAKVPFRDTITIYPRAKANFIAEPNFGLPPLKTEIVVNETSNNILSQTRWDIFQKKQLIASSTEKHPSFTLQKTGRYDIRLIAQNQWGCADTTLREESIAVSEGSFSEQSKPTVTFTNVPDNGGTINIQLLTSQSGDFVLNVLDETGKLVHEENIQTPGGTKIVRYATASLTKGNYEVVLMSKDKTWSEKMNFSKN